MLKKLGNKLKKDQKGMTLIELLAVIVILGIIAAIAVPSILGIIGNSKKDAQIANAQQMLNAAKMAIASEPALQSGTNYISLSGLETKNYLDPVESPYSDNYAKGSSDTDHSKSYVEISEGIVTAVVLIDERATTPRGISVIHSDKTDEVSSKEFIRDNVTD